MPGKHSPTQPGYFGKRDLTRRRRATKHGRVLKPRGSRRAWLTVGVVAVAGAMVFPAMAPATVEEQRQRLPPPAACGDPVEGVWMSHNYYPQYRDWYIFTLEVRRTAHGSAFLTGQITAHSWTGTSRESAPPPCTPGRDHWEVLMPSRGQLFPDGTIHFGGVSWHTTARHCGLGPVSYNADQFSGRINPALQEFQSVDNDGGRSVNEPTVFRRVRCFEPPPVPHPVVAPPPFTLPTRRGGCARS